MTDKPDWADDVAEALHHADPMIAQGVAKDLRLLRGDLHAAYHAGLRAGQLEQVVGLTLRLADALSDADRLAQELVEARHDRDEARAQYAEARSVIRGYLAPDTNWIPCAERMPEDGDEDDMLIWGPDYHRPFLAAYIGSAPDDRDRAWTTPQCRVPTSPITHRRPLPEAPEGT